MSGNEGLIGSILVLVYLGIIVFLIIGMWKVLEKANQPGWACIVPFYNIIVLLRVAGKPLWWIVLFLLPIVSLIPAIIIPIAIGKNFRKGTGFGIGLFLLPFIFYPILGFGDAEYDPQTPAF